MNEVPVKADTWASVLELPSEQAAPKLLGWELSVNAPDWQAAGRIVETEAYHQDDPASHSFRGMTPRTAPMFARAGTIYVYFTYGMHYCLNLVCGAEGRGEAVLIRALEPLYGLDIMHHNRKFEPPATPVMEQKQLRQLTNGPGKLAQALGLTTRHTGTHLDDGVVTLQAPESKVPFGVTQTTRIGIRHAVDQPWRFYISGNPFVSKP